MGTPIHTSVSEVLRIGIDALRGLGFSFSVADRACRMVTWSEAVNGGALRFLRVLEDRIRNGQSARFSLAMRKITNSDITCINASGKCILESGPRAFDLANAGASAGRLALVEVRCTFGTRLLGELMERSATRGLSTLAFVSPGEARIGSAAELDGPAVWLSSPDGTIATAIPRGKVGHRPEMACFAAAVDAFAREPLGVELAETVKADVGDARIVILCAPALDDAHRADFLSAFNEVASAARFDVSSDLDKRWRSAVSNGFEVDSTDWDNLYALIARTRVPASERSLYQAG